MKIRFGRVAIGTAQFGADYGINNKAGKVSREGVFNILQKASGLGIDTVDTAYDYGDSETVLGDYIKSSGADLKVISKLPPCGRSEIAKLVEASKVRLGIGSLYGYLVHNFQSYAKDEAIWGELEEQKRSGAVKKIGFSLYFPSEMEMLLKKGLHLDIVQIPYNIFDQRFKDYLPELKKHGVEVSARSLFLQGLVFVKPGDLPGYFSGIKSRLETLNDLSVKSNMPVAALCFNYVSSNRYIDKIIVGVDRAEHFDEIFFEGAMPEMPDMRIDDEKIILPFNWNTERVKI